MCSNYSHLCAWKTVVSGFFIVLNVAGCVAPRTSVVDIISVEGMVSVRGNEPFTRIVLQTDDRNYYVLTHVDAEQRAALQQHAPARLKVTGEVYLEEWDGRPFAHLRVQSWDTPDDR